MCGSKLFTEFLICFVILSYPTIRITIFRRDKSFHHSSLLHSPEPSYCPLQPSSTPHLYHALIQQVYFGTSLFFLIFQKSTYHMKSSLGKCLHSAHRLASNTVGTGRPAWRSVPHECYSPSHPWLHSSSGTEVADIGSFSVRTIPNRPCVTNKVGGCGVVLSRSCCARPCAHKHKHAGRAMHSTQIACDTNHPCHTCTRTTHNAHTHTHEQGWSGLERVRLLPREACFDQE